MIAKRIMEEITTEYRTLESNIHVFPHSRCNKAPVTQRAVRRLPKSDRVRREPRMHNPWASPQDLTVEIVARKIIGAAIMALGIAPLFCSLYPFG